MPNLLAWTRFIRMLVFTRWPRYLIAGLWLSLAILFSVGTLTWISDIKHVSGTLASVTRVNDTRTGAYKYDALVLAGSSQTYQTDVTTFSPSLAESDLHAGASIELWYTQPPIFEPGVVAIQLAPTADGTPVKYSTTSYTDFSLHPARLQSGKISGLLFAGGIAAVGLVFAAAGRFLPAPESDKRKREKREQAKPRSYGQMVVGTPPSRRTAAS